MRLTRRLAEAEAEFRKAIALSRKATDEAPANTQYRRYLSNHYMNLGGLLIQTGRPAEAEVEFRKALELDPTDTSARAGIQEAEGLAAIQNKLPSLLKGDYKPTTNDERLALARLCIARNLYRASTGQFAEAFAADSKLGSAIAGPDIATTPLAPRRWRRVVRERTTPHRMTLPRPNFASGPSIG